MPGASERAEGIVTPLLCAHKSPFVLNKKFSGNVSRTHLKLVPQLKWSQKRLGFGLTFYFARSKNKNKMLKTTSS